MMSGQTLSIILAFIAILIGLLALREAALDFAERQFSDEFGGDTSDGDWPCVPDDFKPISHAEMNNRGGQRNHG